VLKNDMASLTECCAVLDENMNVSTHHVIANHLERHGELIRHDEHRQTETSSISLATSCAQHYSALKKCRYDDDDFNDDDDDDDENDDDGVFNRTRTISNIHCKYSQNDTPLSLPKESKPTCQEKISVGEKVPVETLPPIWTPLALRDNAPVIHALPHGSYMPNNPTTTTNASPTNMFAPIREECESILHNSGVERQTSGSGHMDNEERHMLGSHHRERDDVDLLHKNCRQCYNCLLEDDLSDSLESVELIDLPPGTGTRVQNWDVNNSDFTLPLAISLPLLRADSVLAQTSMDEEVAMVTHGHVEEEEMMTVEFVHEDMHDSDASRPANPVANILDDGGREHFVPVLTDVFHAACREN
jgi:hypothetical protein